MPQPDRRRDVQGTLASGATAYPGRRPARNDELPQEQVDLDRVAHMRAVPRALQQDQIAPGGFGEGRAAVPSRDAIFGSLDDEHRATKAMAQLEGLSLVEGFAELGGDQGLGRGLEIPSRRSLRSAWSSAAR